MSEHIIQLLKAERSRLQAAIDALKGTPEPKPNNEPEFVKIRPKVAAPPKKKGFSAATRRRMALGQKRRYAAIRAAKAETAAPKVSKKLADVIAPPEDAEFKAKMSAAMKASWAARKKAGKN